MAVKKQAEHLRMAGAIPYRLQLAGGWIDQPFVSRHNPEPPGSMVVVTIEPVFPFMERAGMATGTREVARKLWNGHPVWEGKVPRNELGALTRELYAAENRERKDPSGSQDMIGLIYPGISRLDYDYEVHGGVFPSHIKSINDVRTVRWLERVIHLVPVAQRPEGYSPLGKKNLEPRWVARLGRSGRECFNAIHRRDVEALGASLNECMECWGAILPHTVRHPSIKTDLLGLLGAYQARHPGAMYSGCGGGYLTVVSENPVPGAIRLKLRHGRP